MPQDRALLRCARPTERKVGLQRTIESPKTEQPEATPTEHRSASLSPCHLVTRSEAHGGLTLPARLDHLVTLSCLRIRPDPAVGGVLAQAAAARGRRS